MNPTAPLRIEPERLNLASLLKRHGYSTHELDLSVGCVLEALDRLKRADSTLVIFTSDNGGAGEMSEVQSARKPTEQVIAMKAGLDEQRSAGHSRR